MGKFRKIGRKDDILVNQAANGNGSAFNVKEYRHIALNVSSASSANLTLKIKASLNQTEPTWSSAAAQGNEWDYVAMIDLNDSSNVSGDTGIVLTGTDEVKLLLVNTDFYEWINCEVSGYVAGNINVSGIGADDR